MRFKRCHFILDAAILVLFSAAITAPIVGMRAHLGQLQAQEENRTLAQMPRLTNVKSLAAFPSAFTAYFHDHFGFRKTLIQTRAWVMVEILGASTSPDVIVGRRGWRFYARGLDSYEGLNPFSPGELHKWTSELSDMHDWLAFRGIKFYVILLPDKHTIYPEYLPASIKRGQIPTRLDVLIAALRNSQIDTIDVRERLLRAKSREQLYFQTDTHWNGNAGFVAYQSILAEMSRDFPQLQADPRSYFTEWRPRSTGDLNRMLGLTHGYEEDFLNLVAKNNSVTITQVTGKIVVSERSNPQLPRMVMLRDSFANFLIGMLSQHFRRAVYVWDNRFDPVLMEQEHPDIVLFELVERRLDETSDQSFFASDIAMPASTGNGQQSAGSRRGR